jgi:sulfate permease, SulP family
MNATAARVAQAVSEYKPWVAIMSRRPASPKADVLSGLTVALALVPEAVAFAFVAGVDPMIGLWSACIIGLVTAILGGRPGMISGATGAMAVVIVGLVAMHGVEYLFPAVILCGVLQVTIGLLRLGKLIRMVPHSVMLGFVNGLAIVIGMAQLGSFKTLGDDGLMHFMAGPRLWIMLGLVGLTMGIIFVLPKLTRAVPSTLVAIVTVTLIAIGLNSSMVDKTTGEKPVRTVKDMLVDGSRSAVVVETARDQAERRVELAAALIDGAGLDGPGVDLEHLPALSGAALSAEISSLTGAQVDAALAGVDPAMATLKGTLPLPYFMTESWKGLQDEGLAPQMTFNTLWIILPFSLVLCGVGLIESLMTLSLIDEITETRGRGNRECVGQGAANILCGLFGGMGGCAMIGQSLINVKSGGKGRLSGITAAVCLLLFILVLGPWIELIPMAALVGVMFMVVIGTFEWTTLKTWHRVPMSDVLVMIFVAGYTVLMHDLASAVILGVVISALVFAWQKSTHLFADVKHNAHGSKVYQIHGPLFFASVNSFKHLFDSANDPDDVVIDFYYTRVYDQSGLEAINFIAERYSSLGKRVHLTHLSEECQKLLGKAGDLVEANVSDDPHYHVATDRLG